MPTTTRERYIQSLVDNYERQLTSQRQLTTALREQLATTERLLQRMQAANPALLSLQQEEENTTPIPEYMVQAVGTAIGRALRVTFSRQQNDEGENEGVVIGFQVNPQSEGERDDSCPPTPSIPNAHGSSLRCE